MGKGVLGYSVPPMAALVLASLWLGGCGPQSIASLRRNPHSTYSFEVSNDYRTVYERIVRRARQRYQFITIATRQPGVSAQLFPESRSGTATLWDSGGIGIRYRLTAQIREIDATRTQVELDVAAKKDRQEALLWVTWAGTPLEE